MNLGKILREFEAAPTLVPTDLDADHRSGDAATSRRPESARDPAVSARAPLQPVEQLAQPLDRFLEPPAQRVHELGVRRRHVRLR